MAEPSLDAYLDRIRWDGPTPPTLATLTGLLRAHMCAIPFENLDVLLGRPVRLDLGSIEDKLVRQRRGGYCFEHTALFAAVIERLGFQTFRHSARVVLFTPRTDSPRAHMFLTVPVREGVFVVDPGFGGPGAIVPIRLVDAGDPPPPVTHWVVRDGDYWVLRTRAGDGVQDVWVTTLERDCGADYEMANHYTATHPQSPFVNLIMMGIFTPEGRVTVMNREAAIRRGDDVETVQLADRAALRAFATNHFGIDLPEIEHMRVPAVPAWQ